MVFGFLKRKGNEKKKRKKKDKAAIQKSKKADYIPTPDEDLDPVGLKKLTGQKLRKELAARNMDPPKGMPKAEMLKKLKRYLREQEERKQAIADEESRLKEECRRLDAIRNGDEYIPQLELDMQQALREDPILGECYPESPHVLGKVGSSCINECEYHDSDDEEEHGREKVWWTVNGHRVDFDGVEEEEIYLKPSIGRCNWRQHYAFPMKQPPFNMRRCIKCKKCPRCHPIIPNFDRYAEFGRGNKMLI